MIGQRIMGNSTIDKTLQELNIKLSAALRAGQYEEVDKLKEIIFNNEKILFLTALKKFKEATMELAESWICCSEILDNLTMLNSYPFNTDFQSMELGILKWAQQLEANINNYKGEE